MKIKVEQIRAEKLKLNKECYLLITDSLDDKGWTDYYFGVKDYGVTFAYSISIPDKYEDLIKLFKIGYFDYLYNKLKGEN